MEITTLKKSCKLFSQLYVACQVRDGNLDEFFWHEMAVILHLFPKMVTWCLDQSQTSCIALKNSIRKPQPIIWLWIACSSNRQHDQTDSCDNLPGIRNSKLQLQWSERVDIVWDVYVENSWKSSARHKRGNNINWKGARVSAITIIKKN